MLYEVITIHVRVVADEAEVAEKARQECEGLLVGDFIAVYDECFHISSFFLYLITED